MATSVFFNNFEASREQQLIEDLVTEAIRIYGHDVWYIPRTLNNLDELYLEDSSSSYDSAHMVDMYIKSIDGFQGEGDIMRQFGLEIRDSVTFAVSRRTFSEEISRNVEITRPQEGDIIFLPLNQKFFRVDFVEHESIFYQMGALQVWELKCSLFEYSNERFNTGFPFIDELNAPYQSSVVDFVLIDEAGNMITDERGVPVVPEDFEGTPEDPDDIGSDNEFFQQQANLVLDWTELNPFTEENEPGLF